MGQSNAVPGGGTRAYDHGLVSRLKRGDEAAYAEAVHLHSGRLLAVARRILGNEEDARDCVQETFVQLFRSIERFEGRSSLGCWLHQIVTNAALMRLRRLRRERLAGMRSCPEDYEVASEDALWQTSASPEAEAEGREVSAQVRGAIKALPEPYRRIIEMRDIFELDTAETAERMGISVSNAKVRLHRARSALRAALEPIMGEEATSLF